MTSFESISRVRKSLQGLVYSRSKILVHVTPEEYHFWIDNAKFFIKIFYGHVLCTIIYIYIYIIHDVCTSYKYIFYIICYVSVRARACVCALAHIDWLGVKSIFWTSLDRKSWWYRASFSQPCIMQLKLSTTISTTPPLQYCRLTNIRLSAACISFSVLSKQNAKRLSLFYSFFFFFLRNKLVY